MPHDRLFFLDLENGKIMSCRLDGTDLRTVNPKAGVYPDGIDYVDGTFYWTTMGVPEDDDGDLRRMDFDGKNDRIIVPSGKVRTPKQLVHDPISNRLFFCDREGMRVMSCGLDGSDVNTHVQRGIAPQDTKDVTRWCVGISIDSERQHIYWSQKGPPKGFKGRIFRCPISSNENPSARTDIETLFEDLPEPIDLRYEPISNNLYWTDRGAEPRGNTLNRALLDKKDPDVEILASGFKEAIGLALDLEVGRVFVTDKAGKVYSCDINGGEKNVIVSGLGSLTGCVIVRNVE